MTRRITVIKALRMVAATVVVAGTCTAAGLPDGSEPGVVNAIFADASPLVVGFTVRSHGVEVGRVESIGVKDGMAMVRMRIEESAARPLHRDATARIRPVSLLGERYIDFDRGSPDAPVTPVGQPIGPEHTASSVDLQDVLNTVDKPTGTALAALVTTLGEGQRGRGKDIDAAMALLAPSLRGTDGLVTILNEQNEVLAGLIDRAAPVAGALGSDNGHDLDRLLDSTELLLRTTSANQAAFDEALDRLPQTVTDARAALARLAGVSEQGTETLGLLRPFTDAVPQLTGEIDRFTEATDPALASLDPVLERGRELLDEAGPLAGTLRPAGADLRSVSGSVRPVVKDLSANMDSVMGAIRNWALSSTGFDGITNYFRGVAVVESGMGTGVVPHGVLPPLPKVPGPIDGPGLAQVPKLPAEGDRQNATGLRPNQERDLFGQLLGGN